MMFGPVPAGKAEGAVLAHALKLAGGSRLAKGTVLSADDVAAILATGIAEVIVAVPGSDDIGEDDAAMAIAEALATDGVRLAPAATGRVNIHATVNGLFIADRVKIDAINAADPGITFATLGTLKEVEAGRMVATVKIIPYALPKVAVDHAAAIAMGAIAIEAYSPRRVGVVATRLPSLKESVMDKTIRVLEERLRPSGSRVSREIRTGHDTASIAAAIAQALPESDIVLVFGASAICDIDDVIPSAIRANGGRIEHFGMPVDPGNLMLIGEAGGKPVIGAPGCARSPAENGFDWILQRLIAGRKVSATEITGMGVGGLLMEIGGRPQPRETASGKRGGVAAVVLAAGRSTRMGPSNKLLADLEGKPLLAHVLDAARSSKARAIIAVTGHESELTRPLVESSGALAVHNPDFRAGLSTSLAAGIRAVPEDCDGAIILLGDMPRITAEMIDRMIDIFAAAPEGSIIMAAHGGVRGNPVLWPRRHFEALTGISGDTGARGLIGEHARDVIAVELGEAAAFDLDTPEALAAAGGTLPGN